MYYMQGDSFIASLSAPPLSPRWRASAETYCDTHSCGAQDTDKRNALAGGRKLVYLFVSVNFNRGLKLHCFFSYYLRVKNDVRGLIGWWLFI
jgi:hypothetical protein